MNRWREAACKTVINITFASKLSELLDASCGEGALLSALTILGGFAKYTGTIISGYAGHSISIITSSSGSSSFGSFLCFDGVLLVLLTIMGYVTATKVYLVEMEREGDGG